MCPLFTKKTSGATPLKKTISKPSPLREANVDDITSAGAEHTTKAIRDVERELAANRELQRQIALDRLQGTDKIIIGFKLENAELQRKYDAARKEIGELKEELSAMSEDKYSG